MYSRSTPNLEGILYRAGLWHGPVPGEDQSLQRAAKTQEYCPDQRHYSRGTQGLRVPGERLRWHAHFCKKLQASVWRASLKAFLSDSLRSGPLPPERHSAGRPEAPQVRVCRQEEVSNLRVLSHSLLLSLSHCVCVCVEERCKDRWDLLFRWGVSSVFVTALTSFCLRHTPQVSLSSYHSLSCPYRSRRGSTLQIGTVDQPRKGITPNI